MIAECLWKKFYNYSFQPDNGDLSEFNLILDRYEKIKKTLSRKAGQQKTDGTLPNDNLSIEVLQYFAWPCTVMGHHRHRKDKGFLVDQRMIRKMVMRGEDKEMAKRNRRSCSNKNWWRQDLRRTSRRWGLIDDRLNWLNHLHWKQSSTHQNMALLSDPQGDPLILSQSGWN